MGAGTEDANGLEPARRGDTAGSGTSPGPNCVYIYVRKRVHTHVNAHGRSRTVPANERKRKRTRTQINAPLRLTRGRFLRENVFAFCALDQKLSGCTICQNGHLCLRTVGALYVLHHVGTIVNTQCSMYMCACTYNVYVHIF